METPTLSSIIRAKDRIQAYEDVNRELDNLTGSAQVEFIWLVGYKC